METTQSEDEFKMVEARPSDLELSKLLDFLLDQHPRPWGFVGGTLRDRSGRAVSRVDQLGIQCALQLLLTRQQYESKKTCTKCHEDKVLLEFYQHPTGAKGRDSVCSECRRKYSRDRKAAQK